MAKMNARMMRTKMALEVAAELYTQRMSAHGQRRNDFHTTELTGRAVSRNDDGHQRRSYGRHESPH